MPVLSPTSIPGASADAAETARHWLAGHVEAAVVQAALELGLFARLAERPWTPADLAAAEHLDPRATAVLLEALAGIGVLRASTPGAFDVPDELARADFAALAGAPLQAARVGWNGVVGDCRPMLDAAETALHAARATDAWLVEALWRHAWSGALLELAARGLLARFESGAVAASSPSEAALVRAGEHCGLLAVKGGMAQLTAAGRVALGVGSVPNSGAWMQGRLRMERDYFWEPLSRLTQTLRSGVPATRTSQPEHNGAFRARFTQVNMVLLPLLVRVARRFVHTLDAGHRPLRVLELGSSLGHWGIAFAAAHPGTTVHAVDAPEVLPHSQRIVESARLGPRYTWHADASFAWPAWPSEAGSVDVLVLHEICHTLSGAQLELLLARAATGLAPGGMLLIADMILEPARCAPRRHLLSGVKLLATGGSVLLDTAGALDLLRRHGFNSVGCHRLPVTDLLVARR